MTPRHFSNRGGPYFINDGFTKQNDPIPTTKVSTIGRISAFFNSRAKTRNK